MRVDGDEAFERLREAVEARSAQPRQRNDAIRLEPTAPREPHVAVVELGHGRGRDDVDPALFEERFDRRARGRAEELERLLLGRDDRELDALDAVGSEPPRGHEHELVERERPDGAPGSGEDDAADVTGGELVEERPDPIRVGRPAKRQRARDRLRRLGADRDQQRVVRHRADRRLGLAAAGVHALERAENEGRAGGRCQGSELEALRLAQLERLGDGQRPVPEVRLGPDQLDVEPLLCERIQCENGLECRHTAAGYQDLPGHRPWSVRRPAGPLIRSGPRTGCGFSADLGRRDATSAPRRQHRSRRRRRRRASRRAASRRRCAGSRASSRTSARRRRRTALRR